MVAKNAEQMVLSDRKAAPGPGVQGEQAEERARAEGAPPEGAPQEEEGDVSSSRSRHNRSSRKKKKGAIDGPSSHSVDSLTSDYSDDEDVWQGHPQLPMTPTPETPTPIKDATLVVAATNPISGYTGAPSAEPYSDAAPEFHSDSSSSNSSSCDSYSEEGDTKDSEGATPPSCPAGCSDPTMACTQDHPEDYPVVAYAELEESSDSDGSDTDDDTLLGGRTASINQGSTPPQNNTNVGGPVRTRGFDPPSRNLQLWIWWAQIRCDLMVQSLHSLQP